MKTVKENMNTILLLLCELVVGVLLLIDHNGFLSLILNGVGAVLLISGIVGVIRYIRAETNIAIMQHTLSRGLMQIASGCVFLFGTPWLLSIFPLVTMFCGVGLLLIGIMKIQQAADFYRMTFPCWKLTAINAALCLIAAVLVILNPFSIVDTLWTFAAISLIVISATDLLTLIVKGRK